MVKLRFFYCKKCGDVAIKVVDCGCGLKCCGSDMEELVPNSSGAAEAKHVPVIERDGQTVSVKVGEVEHPMEEDHYIQFIALHTTRGTQVMRLRPGDRPEATFVIPEDAEAIEAFEFCNKHGLWSAKA